MEIEVGEFIRSKQGIILKMINYDEFLDMYLAVNQEGYKAYISMEDIVKHSKNIIDLIEAGDFVNGYKVTHVEKNGVFVGYEDDWETQRWIPEDEFETFVTKEQFEQNAYKFERSRK